MLDEGNTRYIGIHLVSMEVEVDSLSQWTVNTAQCGVNLTKDKNCFVCVIYLLAQLMFTLQA